MVNSIFEELRRKRLDNNGKMAVYPVVASQVLAMSFSAEGLSRHLALLNCEGTLVTRLICSTIFLALHLSDSSSPPTSTISQSVLAYHLHVSIRQTPWHQSASQTFRRRGTTKSTSHVAKHLLTWRKPGLHTKTLHVNHCSSGILGAGLL